MNLPRRYLSRESKLQLLVICITLCNTTLSSKRANLTQVHSPYLPGSFRICDDLLIAKLWLSSPCSVPDSNRSIWYYYSAHHTLQYSLVHWLMVTLLFRSLFTQAVVCIPLHKACRCPTFPRWPSLGCLLTAIWVHQLSFSPYESANRRLTPRISITSHGPLYIGERRCWRASFRSQTQFPDCITLSLIPRL